MLFSALRSVIRKRRRNRSPRAAYLEFLESRVLLTGFSNASLSDTWALTGRDIDGDISFNGAGVITSGLITGNDFVSTVAGDTYTVNSNGTLEIHVTDNLTNPLYDGIGGMNATQDLAVANAQNFPVSGGGAGLTVLLRHTGTFTNTDVAGTWNFATTGARGTFTADSTGHLTGTVLATNDSGGTIISAIIVGTSSYVLNASTGQLTVTIDTDQPQTIAFDGFVNSSKDVMALHGPADPFASEGEDRSFYALKESGAYSNADFRGAYAFAGDFARGTIFADGAGHILAGDIIDSGGNLSRLGGTYSVASNGEILLTIINDPEDGDTTAHDFTGGFNAGKNTILIGRTTLSDTEIANGDNFEPVFFVQSVTDPIVAIVATDGSAAESGTPAANKAAFTVTRYGSTAGALTIPLSPADFGASIGSDYILSVGGVAVTNSITIPAGSASIVIVLTPIDDSDAEGSETALLTLQPGEGYSLAISSATATVLDNERTPLTNADLADTWRFAGLDSEGTIQFNGEGGITGGLLTDTTGSNAEPTGTIDVATTGGLTATLNSNAFTGAINSSRDLVVINQDDLDHTLSILVNHGGVTFSNSDLVGTWNIVVAESGFGSVIFDGEGEITGGSLSGHNGTSTVTGGTYFLDIDGTLTLTIDTNDGDGAQEFDFTGAMNISKDFIALNPVDIAAASQAEDATLVLLVRSTGAYSNADAAGTWRFFSEGGHGVGLLDASGHISSGTFSTADGLEFTISGTYSITAAGKITAVVNTVNSLSASNNQHITLSGAMNAGHNAIIQAQTSGGGAGNPLVLVNSANHAPTLTSVVPLNVAAVGQDFVFDYDTLLTHSNARDGDLDSLVFNITSLGSGVLSLNGAPVTVPAVISPGDILVWTAPSGTGGTITAFSITASDNVLASSPAVAVAINTIVPHNYSLGDMNGPWSVAGVGTGGVLNFDGAGHIVDGNLIDDEGNSETPLGTYDIDSTGGLVISDPGAGALSNAKDFAVISNAGSHSLTLLVSTGGNSFSLADLTGTWTVVFDGRTPESNGGGTITFNGSGSITAGAIATGFSGETPDGSQKFNITGTYTIGETGAITVEITNASNASVISFHGSMNRSKDIVSLTADDLAASANDGNPLLMTFIHSTGTYSNADLKGTWFLNGDGIYGNVTLDGAGHVLNGFAHQRNDEEGVDDLVMGGTYTVAANGKVTVNAIVTHDGEQNTFQLIGALNAGRNVLITNHTGSDTDNNLTVFTSTQDHLPTLTTITKLSTALGGQPFAIPFETLRNASNAADADGDILSFQITTLSSGTFLLNDETPTAPFFFGPEDTLTWTPGGTQSGNVSAFSVKAFDGSGASTTAIPVLITTVAAPTITITATKNAASEISGSTTGKGVFTLTRANGVLSEALDVTVHLSGTATNGDDFPDISTTVHFEAGSASAVVNVTPISDGIAEGSETFIMTVVSSEGDAIYNVGAKNAGTVTIADAASTLSALVAKATASEINGSSSGIGQFSILRTGGDLSIPLTVTFSLSGTADSDNFTITNSSSLSYDSETQIGSVTFAPGKNSALVPFSVINDHTANSPGLKVVLTVTPNDDPAAYFIDSLKANATINIADAASIISASVSKAAASEINASTSGLGQFTLLRTGGDLSIPLTVDFTLTGFAVRTVNYNVNTSGSVTFENATGSGTVTFAAGQNSALVAFTPINDNTFNQPGAPNNVILTIDADANPSYFINSLKQNATINITDAASIISVTATKAASEINGSTSGMGQFTFVRTGGDLKLPLTVLFNFDDSNLNSAVEGADFTTISPHSVTFAPNQTSAKLNLAPISDGLAEGAEDVKLVLALDAFQSYGINVAKSTPILSIADAATTLSIAVSKAAASEINPSTSGLGQFTLTRTGGITSGPLTVNFTLAGTGLSGVNYNITTTPNLTFNGTTGTVTFAAGKTTAVIPFTPLNDGTANATASSVILTINADSTPSYLINGPKSSSTINIADAASTVSVKATDAVASEINGLTTGSGTFTFTRTGGNLKVPLTINYNLSGSASEGSDYTAIVLHSVTFAPNQTTVKLNLNPLDDVATEGLEAALLVLAPDANPSYFIDINKSSDSITIADDTRPLIVGTIDILGDASVGTPFNISYDALLAVTHAQAKSGAISFKITKTTSGDLTKGSFPDPIILNATTLSSGEFLTWTPPSAGTVNAFNVVAVNGTNLSSTLTIRIHTIPLVV